MNWMDYRKIYFIVSTVLILTGVFSLIKWGFNLGVDFTGGTVLEYKIEGDFSTEKATTLIEQKGVDVSSISSSSNNVYLLKLPPLSEEQKNTVNTVLQENYDSVEELRYETVGPTVGPELVKKTIYAIAIAAGVILLWVAYQFKSFKFGASAILAMFHDSFILIGLFSLMGHFFGAEVDFLFVTALLTTLSFSVHDTIVVYDRIRESQKNYDENIKILANKAVTETMVRSLNNSFTILFMLVALLLLGGTTIKWFAAALLIGTILGTYSSPFVAVPLLVTTDEIEKRIKK